MTTGAQSIVGIDIGGTKCAVSRREVDGQVVETYRCPTRGPNETLNALAEAVESLGLPQRPAIGISCGTLRPSEGLISGAPNLPGWDDVPVCEYFRNRGGASAHLLNDAKACALAEWRYGAGRGSRHMAFLTAGTGMGSGLILDGRLYLGAGLAGEVGHVRLAADGPLGYGKKGSFEGFCSGGGIGRWAADWLKARGRNSGFGCSSIEDVSAAAVGAAAVRGDSEARELLALAGERLGEGLAILVDVLHLERIVLGSIYLRSREWLEPAMRRALEREALPSLLKGCQILPSELGDKVGNYGAVAAAEYGAGLYGTS